jgi:hypothetical protein
MYAVEGGLSDRKAGWGGQCETGVKNRNAQKPLRVWIPVVVPR